MAHLQSQAMGSGRSVSEVDADLEVLETERMQLEQRKDAASRKQERLRCEQSGSRLCFASVKMSVDWSLPLPRESAGCR